MKLYEVLSIQNFYNLDKKEIMNEFSRIFAEQEIQNTDIQEETQFYRNEFAKIVDEYAVKENGQLVYSEDMTSIKIIEGKEDECSAKISELKNLEIDLSEFKFSIEEFEKLELSVSDMYGILPLITD